MSHGDRITRLPPGFSRVGDSENAPFALIADEKRRYYGLMFHPEVVHTPDGARLIGNFVHKVAGLKSDWTMAAFRAEAREAIRAKVGKGRVICGLSGGVDSAVAAVLIHEAIGDQLTCVFVDHGLMRAGEGEEVVRLFRDHFNIPLVHVAAERDVPRRARRRRRPRDQAQDDRPAVRRDVRARGGTRSPPTGAAPVEFLAQGTLYPDVIESVSFSGGPSVTIKSHHNVGGLPERMNMKLVEPLARTLQGRSARARARTRPARALRRPPPVPRPRPRHPHARRDRRRRSSTSCARPTRSISKKSAPPASTTRSGRPSPCCCRCAPSA